MTTGIIKTDIYWENPEFFGTISILKETEKAILIVTHKKVKRGTSMVTDHVEFISWIPKSVWLNDKNFTEEKYLGCGDYNKIFKPPYFLR